MRLGNILGSYVKAEEALPAGGCALRGLCRLLSASMAAKVSRAHVRLAEGVKPSGAGDLGVAASLERRGRDFRSLHGLSSCPVGNGLLLGCHRAEAEPRLLLKLRLVRLGRRCL